MVVIALSILPCIVMLFYKHPLLLLYLWPVFILLSAIFVGANVEVDGFAQLPFMFLPMDVVYGFTIMHLGLYAVLQPRRFIGLLKDNPFLSIFLTLVIVYAIIYTPIHGKTALGEARKYYFMFLLPLLALISVRTSEDLRRLMLIVVLCAACVAVVCVLQAVTTGSLVRTQSGGQTLIIAFSMFAMLIHRIYRMVIITRRMDAALLCLFAVMVLWSGQRSVWMATGLGVLLMFALYRSRSTIIAKAGVSIIGVLLSLLMALAVFPRAGEQITQGFQGILNPSTDHTASWRMEGWRQQVDELVSDGRLLFGNGLGSYFRWEFEGREIKVVPHNAYIETLLKLGLLGLTVYGLLVLHFVRNVLAVRKQLPPGEAKAYIEIGLLNFGAAHAFFLGYGFDPIMIVFMALALATAKLDRARLGACEDRPSHLGKLRTVRGRSLPYAVAAARPSVSR